MAGETRYVGWQAGDSTYVCDGIDDHVQINEALAWAKTNPGNTVYLRGPFTYDIALSLEIGSDTELTGDSTACAKLHAAVTWAAQVPLIKSPASVKNVEIHGFEIDCNRAAQNYDEGDGYHNAIGFSGTSSNPVSNVRIHHMYIHDSLGDGVRLTYGSDIRVYNNTINVMGHEGVFFIEVTRGDMSYNSVIQKCNSAFRTDNCYDINIYNNLINKYSGTGANGNGAIQIGNQPSGYGRTQLTQNINIYNNTINDGAGCGILLMDADGSAGTLPQNVHIYNNILTACGWMMNIQYNAGISVWRWGNGLLVEKNTITGCYNAGILAYNGIATGCTMAVKNNNVLNSLLTRATDPAKKLAVSGYGFLNIVPAKIAINAENNYVTGNITGSYYQVTPISEATAHISDALPGGNTTQDDVVDIIDPDPDTGIDIPALRQLQRDEGKNYYVAGRSGYIDGAKFQWQEKKVDVSKSIGQDKSPGKVGWGLTDFDLEGAELTLDCAARDMSEIFSAIAAFTRPGRITVELGGDYSDWQASGVGGNYSTALRLKTIIPKKFHPYSLLLVMDEPYYSSVIERIRSCYIPASMQFSADTCFKGNLVGNSSFENWTVNQSLTWASLPAPAAVDYRRVRWSKELRQFCAVASSGTDNRIMISDGSAWRLPYNFNTVNKNNAWRGLVWCTEWGLWVASSTAGTGGYHFVISSDGDTWYAKAGPTAADGNTWNYALWIPPNETVTNGRVILFAMSGVNPRVLYSDDRCESWTSVASAIEYNNWFSADYSPEQGRIVCVAYGGSETQRVMTSDNLGASWTAQSCPAQKWTSVRWISALSLWVACSEDGTKQIMTSPTGLSGTWTLRDTPVCGSTVVPGTGTDVQTIPYTTQTGYNYTTLSTDWSLGAIPILTISALTNGHIWRLDSVYGKMKTLSSGATAYMKVTVQLGTGAETIVAEWVETSTDYISKSKSLTIESATNQAVTVRFYLKTSNGNVKAAATEVGYVVTEFDGAGGSTIQYTYNQWSELEYAPELDLVVCIAKTGTGNRVMYSRNVFDWVLSVSAADNDWSSLCYSAFFNRWAAVGITGTNRIMTSDTYGSLIGPENWSMATGATRSSDTAVDGVYSLQVTGDGSTVERGVTSQKISVESGKRYIISGFGKVSNLTAGSARLDIMAGGAVIKESIWDANCEWTPKQISFKLNVAPDDVYVRVLGYNLNSGAVINFDKILIQKASDFELTATGNLISTKGTVDTVPDVVVTGVTSNPDTSTPGEVSVFTSPDGYNYTTLKNTYTWQYTRVLPARTDGGVYRLDKVYTQLRTLVAGNVAYLKVTVQAASKNGGVEYTVAEFTSKIATYEPKSRDVAITFAQNEAVTIKYYVKTSNTSVKAGATLMGYALTTMGSGGVVSTSGMYMWNVEDPSTVLMLPAVIPPKYTAEVNADGTGSLSYAENFLDDSFLEIATSKSGVTYDADTKSMVIAAGGSIVFPFDCRYPITGIPFVIAWAKSGNPQFLIAEDVSGNPGTFYSVDDNQASVSGNTEMRRALDKEDNLRLNTKTKYYLKIQPYTSESCEVSSLFVYAATATIDAELFKIYKGGQSNTIAVNVSGRSSVVATLRFRDKIPAV